MQTPGGRAPEGLLSRVRRTRASTAAAAVRLLLGLLFLSTGVMKFAVPELRAAFSGQLVEAGLPLHATGMWLVPAAEMGLGVLFLLGLLVRVASLGGLVLMAAATYVHVVADDPALFPLQPEQPIVPVVAAALCLYLLRVGAGSRSLDLRAGGSDRDVVQAPRTASRGGARVEVEPRGGT